MHSKFYTVYLNFPKIPIYASYELPYTSYPIHPLLLLLFRLDDTQTLPLLQKLRVGRVLFWKHHERHHKIGHDHPFVREYLSQCDGGMDPDDWTGVGFGPQTAVFFYPGFSLPV